MSVHLSPRGRFRGVSYAWSRGQQVTLPAAFTAELAAAEAAGATGSELLPERLAKACAEVLRCDGAGLSMQFAPARRLPLGASDDAAAIAERLQFTVGEGPCLEVLATGRSLLVVEDSIRARWPAFHDALVTHTPFRHIIALPLDGELAGAAALDLFFTSTDDFSSLDLATALAVVAEISAHFESTIGRSSRATDRPAWLDAPAARRRSNVWQALGYLNSELDFTTGEALAVLRGHAYSHDQVIDDVAEDVLSGRLPLQELSLHADRERGVRETSAHVAGDPATGHAHPAPPRDAGHPDDAAEPDAPAEMTGRDPLRSLLHASHLLAADQLPATAAQHARLLGTRELVIYLADYEQATLLPLGGPEVPGRQELPIEGTMAGLAFRRVEVIHSAGRAGSHRLWLPLLNGVARLGVVEMVFPTTPSAAVEDEARLLVSLLAEMVVVNDAYSDAYARLRRRKTLSVAAEIQWDLLPPLTFGTHRVVITGALEPAYDIGGDTFDYAVTGDCADLLILDSVGHGLPSAVLASVAVGAYRHARRNMLELPDTAQAINDVIAGQFGASQFATAVIARLDLDTGRLRWINAGHPPPLILRGPALVQPPHCPPDRPLGLQDRKTVCCETRLEPGDRVLLYTDGITEARSPEGEFFGEQRLADFVMAATAAGDPAPETMRWLMHRVLTHQADQLQDDASIVFLEWRTGDEQGLRI